VRVRESGTETPAPNTGLAPSSQPPNSVLRLLCEPAAAALCALSCCRLRSASMMPPFRRALGALDSSFRFGTCGSSKASQRISTGCCCRSAALLPILHSSGSLHRSARWAPRKRRFSRLGMRTPTRRLDFCSAPQTPMWWLVLVFLVHDQPELCRWRQSASFRRLACCLVRPARICVRKKPCRPEFAAYSGHSATPEAAASTQQAASAPTGT
jgi:hypothetical protein